MRKVIRVFLSTQVVLLAGLFVLMTSMADAKPFEKTLRKSGLSPEDMKLLAAAELSLYENGNVFAGKKKSWRNEETNAQGQASLRKVAGNCAIVRHKAVPQNKPPIEIEFEVCKNQSGKWLLTAYYRIIQ